MNNIPLLSVGIYIYYCDVYERDMGVGDGSHFRPSPTSSCITLIKCTSIQLPEDILEVFNPVGAGVSFILKCIA
jgi:hypothetical protein